MVWRVPRAVECGAPAGVSRPRAYIGARPGPPQFRRLASTNGRNFLNGAPDIARPGVNEERVGENSASIGDQRRIRKKGASFLGMRPSPFRAAVPGRWGRSGSSMKQLQGAANAVSRLMSVPAKPTLDGDSSTRTRSITYLASLFQPRSIRIVAERTRVRARRMDECTRRR